MIFVEVFIYEQVSFFYLGIVFLFRIFHPGHHNFLNCSAYLDLEYIYNNNKNKKKIILNPFQEST